MEAYICRGRFADNLESDWLRMISLDGAVVSLCHVTYSIQDKAQCATVKFMFILSLE